MLQEKLESIKSRALEEFQTAESSKSLYDLKVKYLGKQGEFSQVMKEMGKLSKEERPKFGKLVNEIKTQLETSYGEVEGQIKKKELQAQLDKDTLDLSLPGPKAEIGAIHPLSEVTHEIVKILSRIGFSVRLGPLIESDRYNFEALNMPSDHPARDMQDTFYITEEHVLRTHTSPVQIRTMENETPPIRIVAPGPVFRKDHDASHSPNFNQIEGLLIDSKVSMADLKGTITFFVREFFGSNLKTRFRPSFFPFTEPSAEVDCQCPICKGKGCQLCGQTGWVEIGGSGLVHPNVLKASGIDAKRWQGYAFGFGIERMALIKYGIDDIRILAENNVKFLRQFKR